LGGENSFLGFIKFLRNLILTPLLLTISIAFLVDLIKAKAKWNFVDAPILMEAMFLGALIGEKK